MTNTSSGRGGQQRPPPLDGEDGSDQQQWGKPQRSVTFDTSSTTTDIRIETPITLSDVQLANPLESEAETGILQMLEEGTQAGDASAGAVLPLVSDDDANVLTTKKDRRPGDQEEDEDETPEKGQSSRRAQRRAGLSENSLANRLAGLNSALHHHAQKDSQDRVGPKNYVLDTADALVANCDVLFRRRSSNQPRQRRRRRAAATKQGKPSGDEKVGDDDQETGTAGSHLEVLQSRRREVQRGVWQFIETRQPGVGFYLKLRLVIGVVLLGIAALLYYAVGNPLLSSGGASVSWLLIFLVRQLVMTVLTRMTEHFVIGYLSLEARWTTRVFGMWSSLALVQSKGLPFRMVFWAIYCICLLAGPGRLAQHWLFWQDPIHMFNSKNPSGNILSSSAYIKILFTSAVVGLFVSLKRFWWGLRIGKKTYQHFGDQVSKVIEKMLLLSEISTLSVTLGRTRSSEIPTLPDFSPGDFDVDDTSSDSSIAPNPATEDSSSFEPSIPTSPTRTGDTVIDQTHKNAYTGSLNQSQKIRMIQLLGSWEEPDIVKRKEEPVSINAILEFRQALSHMETIYPFSLSFGLADTREHCVESAQRVYERLVQTDPDQEMLRFETIAQLAIDRNGKLDATVMKDLIRLLRPDRKGYLSMLEFVKAVDTVYKDIKMLRASIKNSGQIDSAAETVMNCIFYSLVVLFVAAFVGVDPVALFASISSLIIGFGFMIGNAASDFFKGMMFILGRRPYGIGDRISVISDDDEFKIEEGNTWFVQNVDLFTTTIRSATTNQVALASNGDLSVKSIINCKRSPKATRHIKLKFDVNVDQEKLKLFRRSVEDFVRSRPRDWLSMHALRPIRVDQDEGYTEYTLCLQHRESWQAHGPIMTSTAEVESYCYELSKELGMKQQDDT